MISFGWEGGAAGLALAAAALLLWAWNVRLLAVRSRLLLALRTAAIAMTALWALQWSVHRIEARVRRPRLAIVVDTGLTMGAKDGGGSSRLRSAAGWLTRRRDEIESRAQVLLYAGADRCRRVGWEELDGLEVSDQGFDPRGCLEAVSEGEAPSRLWMLSDGNAEEGGGPGPGPARGVPADWIGVGARASGSSLAAAELQAPDFVFLHSRFPVRVVAEAAGLKGAVVVARLWKGPEAVGEVRLPVGGDFEALSATFTATAATLGLERYRLELDASGPERRTGRGLRTEKEFGVEVIRQKHRIMYLSGRPSPEYAQLRELLKSNPNFELVSFVILRNPENVSPVPDQELSLIPFPAQEIFVENLMQFDIFILENFAYWRFNLPAAYLEGLRRFVSQGGALLVIGGSNAYAQGGYRGTPLEEALPVSLWPAPDDFVPGPFQPRVPFPGHPLVRLADTPEESLALWEALPPLDGFNRFSGLKPGASALLVHPSQSMPGGGPMPLMALREFGKGKVMALGTGSTWRWRLGGGADWRLGAFYARFWSRAVEYLTGTLELKKVKFSPLPERMPGREPALLALRVFDESFRPLLGPSLELSAAWTPPGKAPRPVVLREREAGTFDIELTGLEPGVHSLRAWARYRGSPWGEDQVRFRWAAGPPEVPVRRRWMQEEARKSGGRYDDLERFEPRERLRDLPASRTERLVLRTWRPWSADAWFWALAALLLAEWALRRWKGYV